VTLTPSSEIPPVFPTNTTAEGSPKTSVPIRSITDQDNQTNPTILAPPEAPSAIPKPSLSKPVDEIHSKDPGWSVSHNPEITQTLQIDLAKTLNFTARVFCVKFSPDGKYLAVGLDQGSGRTYIYDMEKGLNIWSVPSYHKRKTSADFSELAPWSISI
jgi:WD40 repeat protein